MIGPRFPPALDQALTSRWVACLTEEAKVDERLDECYHCQQFYAAILGFPWFWKLALAGHLGSFDSPLMCLMKVGDFIKVTWRSFLLRPLNTTGKIESLLRTHCWRSFLLRSFNLNWKTRGNTTEGTTYNHESTTQKIEGLLRAHWRRSFLLPPLKHNKKNRVCWRRTVGGAFYCDESSRI